MHLAAEKLPGAQKLGLTSYIVPNNAAVGARKQILLFTTEQGDFQALTVSNLLTTEQGEAVAQGDFQALTVSKLLTVLSRKISRSTHR